MKILRDLAVWKHTPEDVTLIIARIKRSHESFNGLWVQKDFLTENYKKIMEFFKNQKITVSNPEVKRHRNHVGRSNEN